MIASELRVGNYVYGLNPKDHSDKILDKIATIYSHGWETEKEYEGIDPIPLTEEWLSKFGFEKIEEDEIWVLSVTPDFSFMLTFTYEDDFSIAISDVPDSPNSICPSGDLFKYVHQFQNLYFILTGTELEIKE